MRIIVIGCKEPLNLIMLIRRMQGVLAAVTVEWTVIERDKDHVANLKLAFCSFKNLILGNIHIKHTDFLLWAAENPCYHIAFTLISGKMTSIFALKIISLSVIQSTIIIAPNGITKKCDSLKINIKKHSVPVYYATLNPKFIKMKPREEDNFIDNGDDFIDNSDLQKKTTNGTAKSKRRKSNLQLTENSNETRKSTRVHNKKNVLQLKMEENRKRKFNEDYDDDEDSGSSYEDDSGSQEEDGSDSDEEDGDYEDSDSDEEDDEVEDSEGKGEEEEVEHNDSDRDSLNMSQRDSKIYKVYQAQKVMHKALFDVFHFIL
jgi:hypothetical protein